MESLSIHLMILLSNMLFFNLLSFVYLVFVVSRESNLTVDSRKRISQSMWRNLLERYVPCDQASFDPNVILVTL